VRRKNDYPKRTNGTKSKEVKKKKKKMSQREYERRINGILWEILTSAKLNKETYSKLIRKVSIDVKHIYKSIFI